MHTTLTYVHVEWYALLALLKRSDAPALTAADLPARISNEVGRSWIAGKREASVELAESDAATLRELRAGLPDAEALAAIAEAEKIVRFHQRGRAPR